MTGVTLGGGVVGDLAGFVASTARGIHFVQIPTSLTAQVDSSIGGKDRCQYALLAKSMVGTFAQPDGVLIDPQVLQTLGNGTGIEGKARCQSTA